MLIALARLGNPEMVGQFALGLAITGPVAIFANMNLRAVQATDARGKYRFSEFLALRMITIFLAMILIVLIVIFNGYERQSLLIILSIGLWKAVDSLADIFYGFFQKHEKMDLISKSMIIKGTISLVIMSACLYSTKTVVWGVFGVIFSSSFVLAIYDFGNYSKMVRKVSQDTSRNIFNLVGVCKKSRINSVWRLAIYSFPLGVVVGCLSLNSNIPNFLIEKFMGKENLGIFAALSYLLIAGQVVVGALGNTASPRLAYYYELNDLANFKKLLKKMINIGMSIGIFGLLIVVFFGENILGLVYGTEYEVYSNILVILVLGAIPMFVFGFLGTALTAMQCFKAQSLIHILRVVFVSVFSVILINAFGLYGAAIIYTISPIVGSVAFYLIIREKFECSVFEADKTKVN